MRKYRKNGTPIGDRKVYVVKPGSPALVWEIIGHDTWEEAVACIPLEAMTGAFDFEQGIEIVVPGAKLSSLRLAYADFTDGDLRNADLRNSDLTAADFCGVDLRGAVLWGAELGLNKVIPADFTGAKRLDSDHPISGWKVVNGRLVRDR